LSTVIDSSLLLNSDTSEVVALASLGISASRFYPYRRLLP
jgi:hypothetical protein